MSINTNIRKEGEYLGSYLTPYDVWNVYPNPHEGSFMIVLEPLSLWVFKDGKWQNASYNGSISLSEGDHIQIDYGIISVKATSQNIVNTVVQRDGYGSVDFNDVEVNTLSDDNDNSYAFPGSSDAIKKQATKILATLDDIKQTVGLTKEEADGYYQPKGDYAKAENITPVGVLNIHTRFNTDGSPINGGFLGTGVELLKREELYPGLIATCNTVNGWEYYRCINPDEYLSADAWEQLTKEEIDLSGYAKAEDITSAINDLKGGTLVFETIKKLEDEVFANSDKLADTYNDVQYLQRTVEKKLTMEFISQADYDALSDKSNTTCYAIVSGDSIVAMYTGAYKWNLCGCSTPEEDDTTTPKMYYGYVVDDELMSYADITSGHLVSATMTTIATQSLVKTSIGDCPAGSRILIAVPASTGYVVTKDNGIGGKVAFDESIIGANGTSVTIDNTEYLVFGEFSTIDGERFIYID